MLLCMLLKKLKLYLAELVDLVDFTYLAADHMR